MTIDWLHFFLALLLLWFPRQVLRRGGEVLRLRRRHRPSPMVDINPAKMREPGDPRVLFMVEIVKPRNYIDFFRATVGSVMLLGGFAGFEAAVRAADDAPGTTVQLVLYGRLLILAIAVMIQSFRFERKPTMFPPIFFLSGVALGLCGPFAAGFSLVLVWTINLTLPNPTAFLSVFALLVGGFGLLFLGTGNEQPFFAVALIFLPVLVSLLARRRLVLFTKKVKRTSSSALAS